MDWERGIVYMIILKEKIEQHFRACSVRSCLRWLMDKEQQSVNSVSEMSTVYPFTVDDVRCIYTFHQQKGKGTWFHLIDGSIWNEYGQQEDDLYRDDFL